MLGILIMVGNYFHDLAVALLASNILVVWIVGRFADSHQVDLTFMQNLFGKLSRITYYAFGYVILGGAFRGYFFMDYEWNPAVGKGQVAALVVKHILLFTITIIGLTLHQRYQKRYGKPKA